MSEPFENVRPISPSLQVRVPPQDLDAERAILGGILLDNGAINDVLEIIGPECFYASKHRKVFEGMVSLDVQHKPIDSITLKEQLVEIGTLEDVGEEFIGKVDLSVPSASNLAYYARIVLEKYLTRRAIEAACAIATEGYERHGDVHEFIDHAEARFFAIQRERTGHSFRHAKDGIPKYLHDLDTLAEQADSIVGVPSGIRSLDLLTTGWRKANVVVVAARPGMGKTAFGLSSAVEASTGGAAGFFSLEQPFQELLARLVAQRSGVSLQRLRTGRLLENDWPKVSDAASKVAALDLHIDDSPALTALEIRGKARRLARNLNGRLRLLVIDYLQLMSPNPSARSREEAVADNSRQIKSLAKELDLPVMLLAQLNREVEKRPGRRPQLSDLRESGSVEQDADLVIFPYREKDGDEAELIIAKQRNGPTGSARAQWIAHLTMYRNHPDDHASQRTFDDVAARRVQPQEPARMREEPPLPEEQRP